MCLKKQKPVTPSLRHTVLIKKNHLSSFRPLKHQQRSLKKTGGRNNSGKITVRHIGGGLKNIYRQIDFKRQDTLLSVVLAIEYDPNRSGFIARMRRLDFNSSFALSSNKKQCYYILAPRGLKVGDFISSGFSTKLSLGNALCLKNIPLGSQVYNVPFTPGSRGKIIRSAGTYGQIMKKQDDGFVVIRLPSGELRLIPEMCKVSLGIVSNIDSKLQVLGKAGRVRWKGTRPTVRGVAMNPVDHPHGGGEGKTSGGRPSVTPWGRITKGPKTRNKKKNSKLILKKRPIK
jgi:large subunit ribosomal protein L2